MHLKSISSKYAIAMQFHNPFLFCGGKNIELIAWNLYNSELHS